MQQRLGIAQALIAEPDLLILDELDAGLDPIGRHDLREVLLDLKRKGTTLFFSSHELTEVEALCDRVIVIHRGRLLTEAPVSSLMQPLNQFEITFAGVNGATLPESIARLKPHELGDHFQLMTQQVEDYLAALTQLIEGGFQIQRTSSRTRSLEDHFIDLVGQGEGTA
jgi:ABC-2 type transport system ATP-binding protein